MYKTLTITALTLSLTAFSQHAQANQRTISISIPPFTSLNLSIKTNVMSGDYKYVKTFDNLNSSERASFDYVLTDEDIKGASTIDVTSDARTTQMSRTHRVNLTRPKVCGTSLSLEKPIKMEVTLKEVSRSKTTIPIIYEEYDCSISQQK